VPEGLDAQGALQKIKTSLDEQAAKATAGVTLALKKAFTDAIRQVYFWGLFVIALGFVLTLLMPELALKKTAGAASIQPGKGGTALPQPESSGVETASSV
jgi:hypothetical protein